MDEDRFKITGKLDAFVQLELLRRLTPALPLMDIYTNEENKGKDKTMLTSILLGRLSDDASSFVVKTCLSVVHMVDGNGAFPIIVKGTIMYQTIELSEILSIVGAVLEDNLGNFFRTVQTGLAQEG
jgi:hypothetical protein